MPVLTIIADYDGSTTTSVKDDASTNVTIGSVYKAGTHRGFLRFPLSDLPSNVQISQVRLYVYCNFAGGSAHLLDVHAYGTNGQEDPQPDAAATCYNRCASGNLYYDDGTDLRTTGSKWIVLGGSIIQDIINAKNAVNRFALGLHEEGDNDSYALIDALESYRYPAKLEITYEVAATLTINVDKLSGYIGDVFTFTGVLTEGGSPVKGVIIKLYKNATEVGSDVTGLDGTYEIPWTADAVGTYDFHSEAFIGIVDFYSEENCAGTPPENWGMHVTSVHPSVADEHRGSSDGQAFKVPSGYNYKLKSVKFYLAKVGNPVGNLVARLYNATGTLGTDACPIGEPLATSNPVAMESLDSTYKLVEFTFPSDQQYIMTGGTVYCIVVEVRDATVIDDNNYLLVGIDNVEPTHPGNECYHFNGNWHGYYAVDAIFYVHGEVV